MRMGGSLVDAPEIIYIAPIFVAALMNALLALSAWRRRAVPGALAFTAMLASISLWSFCYGAELLAMDVVSKVWWHGAKYLGVVAVPGMWLVFVLQYTGNADWLNARARWLLAVEPLGILAITWSNSAYGVMHQRAWLEQSGPLTVLAMERGAWFWAHATYSYALLGLGALLLCRAVFASRQRFRAHGVCLLIGLITPWLGNALFLLHLLPVARIDATPFGFTVSGLALGWGFFRVGLLDAFLGLIPAARNAVVAGMRDGVIVLDAAGRVMDANQAAERMVGLPAPSLVGLPVEAVLGPSVGGLHQTEGTDGRGDGRAEGGAEGSSEATEIALGPEGATRVYDLVVSPLRRGGELAGSLLVLRDVTERKRAEAALRESEERYRALVEDASDVIFTCNLKGRVTSLNAAGERLTGYSRAEIRNMDATPLIAPESREVARRVLLRALTGAEPAVYELELIAKDGRRVAVEVNSRVISRHGVHVGIQGVARDISERRRTQQELQDVNARLQRALDDLRATQQHVIQQERLHALGTMASGIAHDFNNMLAPVVGFSELLLSDPRVLADPAESRDYLQMIHTSAQDAAHVVDRLREFYRHREEGEVFAPVHLNRLVEQVVSLTQPKWRDQALARGRTIRVETDLHELPLLVGNEPSLREAVTNLVFNAVDALPDGGTITLRTRATRTEGGGAVLEVADDGMGMTEEVRRRCLEPFFSTKGDGGTGLGLAMVHGIVERHNGTMAVSSAVGAGTTVRIAFPRPVEGARPVPAPPAPEPEAGAPLRVLVVDDNASLRQLLSKYVVADGHEAETAASPLEALELLGSRRFDVLVTDRAMPGMSGDQLAAAAKHLAPEMPVVLVTGFGRLMVATGERPAGVDAILGKPVTRAQLREVIARVRQGAGARAALASV